MICCAVNTWFLKLFLLLFLLQHSLGFDSSEEDKRDGFNFFSHIGKDKLLQALKEKSVSGDLIVYPRLGRHIWEIHQALLPYPRAGRLIVDTNPLDYVLLNADFGDSLLEDSLVDERSEKKKKVHKRRNVKLIPRIGRKKRSVGDEEEKKESDTEDNDKEITKPDLKALWNSLEDLDNEYYFRTDKKSIRSKNAFVPRIGKKRSDYLSDYEDKRAVAFTPRIGRASFVPRIGRSDPRFRLKSRGAFVPRIGRRAALIPRIGRSSNQQNIKDN